MTNALLGLVAKLRERGRALVAEMPDQGFTAGETVFDEIADELEAVLAQHGGETRFWPRSKRCPKN